MHALKCCAVFLCVLHQEVLAELGCDVHSRNLWNRTALDWAMDDIRYMTTQEVYPIQMCYIHV
jgi:hypothetical protein